MRDEAIVEALKRTSLPQCGPRCRTRFGPPRAYPNQGTCAFFVRRPDRTSSPQDLQLETPPQYALAGNPVIAPHLPLCASLSAAGCLGCPLPVGLLSHLRYSQGSQEGLPGIRSGCVGLSEYHREGRMCLLLLRQRIACPAYGNRVADRAAFLSHQACPSIGYDAVPIRQIFAIRRRPSL